VVTEFFDVFAVLKRILAVRGHDVAEDVFVLMLNLIGKCDNFSVHVFHLLFDSFFQHVESGFFLFTLTNGLSNLLIILNITISQDSFEILFILGKFLLVSAFLIREMPELFFFLLVLTTSADAGF
jgi:hypothetical protein